ncbi:MAG: plastocyanin/azurin family copper-binding protein [Chthoniobacterales bacterium]
MKVLTPILLALALVLPGCSHHAETGQPKTVEITGNDEMKFDVTHFEVKPGQKVTLTLTNIGELPKDAMAHNWVLLKQGTDAAKLVAAGADHPETDYIPAAQAKQVLFKTKVLGPGESDTITLTAPAEPGSYEYICSFPDHYTNGMKGVMTVTPAAK